MNIKSQSVAGGWQSILNGQILFGPVFSTCPALWKWQSENSKLLNSFKELVK